MAPQEFPSGMGKPGSHPPGMLQWVWGSTSSQIQGFHPAFPTGLDPRVQFCNTNGILSSYLGKIWEFRCQEGTTFPQENLPLPGPYSTKIPLASQTPWGFPCPEWAMLSLQLLKIPVLFNSSWREQQRVPEVPPGAAFPGYPHSQGAWGGSAFPGHPDRGAGAAPRTRELPVGIFLPRFPLPGGGSCTPSAARTDWIP